MKSAEVFEEDDTNESLPSRERGLKSQGKLGTGWFGTSLPSRERGLKFYYVIVLWVVIHVAPFAGAWIEIMSYIDDMPPIVSLPSRERGLKLKIHGDF